MSLQDYQSPSQVSVNTKRLSAMIDSLHGDQDDDELFQVRDSSGNTTPKRIQPPHPQLEARSNQGSPTKLHRSPAGVVSLNSPDKGYRFSMLSNYSGVVQEAVGVSYVVKNPSRASKVKSTPNLPTFPSEETLNLSRQPTGTSNNEDIVLKSVRNVKSIGELSSGFKPESNENPDGSKQDSLKLLSINSNRRAIAPSSSIGSGNMASESGSSSHKLVPSVMEQKFTRISTPQVESDADSIATSVIPEVITTKRNDEGVPPVRSETNDYNPAIPPRSRNRPASRILLQDDEEQEQEGGHSRGNRNLKGPDSLTRGSSATNKSDTYFSAASFDVEGHRVEVDLTSEGEEDGDDTVDDYLSRPLPTVPQSAQIHRDSTVKREQGREPEVVTTLASSSVQDQTYDSDEQYEYIDEAGRVIESTTPQKNSSIHKAKSRKRVNSKKKKQQQELRQFDVDTLSQLLNVTKGTLIGAEFANLGMKIEEKRALERLVDSLSRLTADMVLDPDRHEEGLKRLQKATKALEGF